MIHNVFALPLLVDALAPHTQPIKELCAAGFPPNYIGYAYVGGLEKCEITFSYEFLAYDDNPDRRVELAVTIENHIDPETSRQFHTVNRYFDVHSWQAGAPSPDASHFKDAVVQRWYGDEHYYRAPMGPHVSEHSYRALRIVSQFGLVAEYFNEQQPLR